MEEIGGNSREKKTSTPPTTIAILFTLQTRNSGGAGADGTGAALLHAVPGAARPGAPAPGCRPADLPWPAPVPKGRVPKGRVPKGRFSFFGPIAISTIPCQALLISCVGDKNYCV